jgi:hypothetical protein
MPSRFCLLAVPSLRTPLRSQRPRVEPEMEWIPFGADGIANFELLFSEIQCICMKTVVIRGLV